MQANQSQGRRWWRHQSPAEEGRGIPKILHSALLGRGVNEKEQREVRQVTQTTGETGRTLPEEFRAGLDEYFQRWERTP